MGSMTLEDLKSLASAVAIVLAFVGYAPYISDVVKGRTRPHIFSWLIWTIVTAIIFALQVNAGAGSGAYVTLALVGLLLAVLLLALRNGDRDIKRTDVAFLVLAILCIPLWLVVEQPVLSIVVLSTIDMLGFAPTLRKSWTDPFSETLSLYVITTLRHGLSILALFEYNIVTMLFPLTWVFANAAFAVLLIVRRRQLGHPRAGDAR
ncbi:MAG: hypothetical protein ACK5GN_15260 [Pseudomonadota bacterium]|jgi:hypothetical protein